MLRLFATSALTLTMFLTGISIAQADMMEDEVNFSNSVAVPDKELAMLRGGFSIGGFDFPTLVDFSLIRQLVAVQTDGIDAQVRASIETIFSNGVPVIRVSNGKGDNVEIPDLTKQLTGALEQKTTPDKAALAANLIQSGLDVAADGVNGALDQGGVEVKTPALTPIVLHQSSFSLADIERIQREGDGASLPTTFVLQTSANNMAYFNQMVLNMTLDKAAFDAVAVTNATLQRAVDSSSVMGMK